MEDKKLYYLFTVSVVIVFAVAFLLKTTQLISTLEASLLLAVSFLLGIGGAYYGYKFKKKDFPNQEKQDSLKSKKKIPLSDNVVKSFRIMVILFFFWLVAMGMIFAGLSYYSNNQWPEPDIPGPLTITFELPEYRGEFSNATLGMYDQASGRVTSTVAQLYVPMDTKAEVTYSISARSFEENSSFDGLTNVKLGCDYVDSNLTFSDAQGQPHDIPFELDIGTMELGDTKVFSGFLETNDNPNTFDMYWHVSSDQISYTFSVVVPAYYYTVNDLTKAS